MKRTLAATMLVLAFATTAQAASPLVPVAAQTQIVSVLSAYSTTDFAYIPTRAPEHFTYQSSTQQSTRNLLVLQQGTGRNKPLAYFTAAYFKGKASSCGKGSQVTLKINGHSVYSRGQTAWRCQKAPSGKLVEISITGSGLTRVELGTIVGYAKRIPS